MWATYDTCGLWDIGWRNHVVVDNSVVKTPDYFFVVGKIKPAFTQKLSHRATEPQSHIAYRIVFSSAFLIMILPVHSMYWPTRLQRIMLQDFLRRVSFVVGLRSTLNLPLALMGLHTRLTVSAETYEVYNSFTLLIHVIALWYIHWCTVCASILIQGWHRYTEAWPFEVGSLQRWYQSTCWL